MRKTEGTAVLIAADPPAEVREKILACFPGDWSVRIAAEDRLGDELARAEALIPEHLRADEALLDKAPRLRFIQTGAGYDNVDLAACSRRGIRVCSAAGVNAGAVAEHVMALLLSRYKNIPALDRGMKERREVGELRYAGGELAGKTVGIVGLGAVGSRVAALCGAFGMRVLGCSRSGRTPPGVEPRALDSLCRESDVISLHVPLTEETRDLVDAAFLARMKGGALLINSSRGGVVNEEDLVRALRDGRIGGACLDVFREEPLPADSPLRGLENVILTPHTAGYPDGPGFHRRRYAFFAENIARFLRGETPENLLNP